MMLLAESLPTCSHTSWMPKWNRQQSSLPISTILLMVYIQAATRHLKTRNQDTIAKTIHTCLLLTSQVIMPNTLLIMTIANPAPRPVCQQEPSDQFSFKFLAHRLTPHHRSSQIWPHCSSWKPEKGKTTILSGKSSAENKVAVLSLRSLP